MTKYSDIRKRNIPGYPKSIYDDGQTKLEVWKFHRISILTLLIANKLITKAEPGAINLTINGVDYLSLDLPSGMNPLLREALDCRRFQRQDDPHDLTPTDEFLIIQLGHLLANQIGSILDKQNVQYRKDAYLEFKKNWSAEMAQFEQELEALDRADKASTRQRPTR